MTIKSSSRGLVNTSVVSIFNTPAAKSSGCASAPSSTTGDLFLFEGCSGCFYSSPLDESSNTACSPGSSDGGIVGFDAGLGSGVTRGMKLAKRVAWKNNYRDVERNKLATGRWVDVASDGGAGFIIVRKRSRKPVVPQDADTAFVRVLSANELIEDCVSTM